jgi:hypothetical protein
MQVVLPPFPEREGVEFFTYSGTLIARGYTRVVFGGRGPYVEFSTEQIVQAALVVPELERWRFTSSNPHFYYWEYRSNDPSNVKVYLQRRLVDYADYRVGMWYISPFELHTREYGELICWEERS